MKQILLAGVSTVTVIFVVTFIFTALDSIGNDIGDIRIVLLVSAVAALVGLVVVALWALPIHLLLSYYKKSHIGWYIGSAVVPSFSFVYMLKPFGHDSDMVLLLQALFCSFAGVLGAIAFWYIAVFRQRIVKY